MSADQVVDRPRTSFKSIFVKYVQSRKWFQRMEKSSGIKRTTKALNPRYSHLTRNDLMKLNFHRKTLENLSHYVDFADLILEEIISAEIGRIKMYTKSVMNVRKHIENLDVDGLHGKLLKKANANIRCIDECKTMEQEREYLKECLSRLKNLNDIIAAYSTELNLDLLESSDMKLNDHKSDSEQCLNSPCGTIVPDLFDVLKEIDEQKDQCEDEVQRKADPLSKKDLLVEEESVSATDPEWYYQKYEDVPVEWTSLCELPDPDNWFDEGEVTEIGRTFWKELKYENFTFAVFKRVLLPDTTE